MVNATNEIKKSPFSVNFPIDESIMLLFALIIIINSKYQRVIQSQKPLFHLQMVLYRFDYDTYQRICPLTPIKFYIPLEQI